MKATTKDLRLKTRELIAATDRGEEVIITFRGKQRAMLVPLRNHGSEGNRKRNPAFGLWRDDQRPVDAQVRAMRQVRNFD